MDERAKTARAGLLALEKDIFSCPAKRCGYRKGWNRHEQRSHGREGRLPSQWCHWAGNRYPCERTARYTLFEYDGRSNLVFVALRPSTGFLSNSDIVFADVLKSLGRMKEVYDLGDDGRRFVFYRGAFVTDLIKCRGLASGRTPHIPAGCLGFFKKELEIVGRASGKPPALIAVGDRARSLLWKHREELGLKYRKKDDVIMIPHYHQRKPHTFAGYRSKVEAALKKIETRS